jgi:pyridoxine 5-phosphate synthase
MKLGVNIDHVATLRQARRGQEPDPVHAAVICESNGADSIVAHLREDRRHISDKDVRLLKDTVRVRFNLEMSLAAGIVRVACSVRPDQATLVPEERRELTTEGGLDVAGSLRRVADAVRRLKDAGIDVSLFIDPDERQVDAARKSGVRMIELHTGVYAGAQTARGQAAALKDLQRVAGYARGVGLAVNAGHGLDYVNVGPVAAIPGIEELNIGYSIISRALFVGLGQAVREMKDLILKG